MKGLLLSLFFFLSLLLTAQTRYDVASGEEFSTAQEQATAGDTIAWLPGTYTNTRMDINKDGLIVTAKQNGTVLFTGVSRAVINADHISFSGFQYIGGLIGNLHVIRVFGSDVLITQVNIQNYTCHKYLLMDETCRNNTISYCNFENRLNKADQNILSVLVDEEPGYHKIQHCSFKNFEGIGKDEGVEPIRIGVSSQGHLDSRTLVEYCYFTQCNGDGEIISHKSRQNVYRYNTFENNPVAELVLRHGNEGIIYGNFFLNNMGGIRVREGSDHFIYNNYFEGINKRAIYLMNDPVDPLSNIHIYHNTILDSEEIIFGGNGNNPPTNVIIANNVFTNPRDVLTVAKSGEETWISNISFGDFGIDFPSTGISETDPELIENIEGFFQPRSNSPVIAAASEGFPTIPLYPGMDYDNEISFDVMKESRPMSITDRAIGASEFSPAVNVKPHATEMNTGPAYLFDNLVNYVAANASKLFIGKEGESRSIMISSNMDWIIMDSLDWLSTDISSGSGDAQFNILIDANEKNMTRSGTLTIAGGTESVSIGVEQDADQTVSVFEIFESKVKLSPNPATNIVTIEGSEKYDILSVFDQSGRKVMQTMINNQLESLDISQLQSGVYVVKFEGKNKPNVSRFIKI